ncbi:MAG: hypothetical protein IPM92_06490 [Saprospiraceae bacterium]|nr:hypothetical protein [Saprospiraceae bacterium]
MKKFLKILGIMLGLILLLMSALPFLFKDRLNDQIRREVNAAIIGSFDFKDLKLSLFRDFPNLSLGLVEPVCKSFVAADTSEIFKAKEVFISLGLWDVLMNKETFNISTIRMNTAQINIIQYDSLQGNFQMVQANSSAQSKQSDFQFKIDDYEINNSSLNYTDLYTNQELVISGIQQKGSFEQFAKGQKTQSITTIESLSFVENSVALLKNVQIHAVNNLELYDDGKSILIAPSKLQLNEFSINYQGGIKINYGEIVFDKFLMNSPSTEFKDIFSILPNAYTKDFKQVVSSGKVSLDGMIDGAYSDSNKIYPSWKVKLDIQNGELKYPEKNLKLRNFNLNLHSENASNDMSNSYLELSNFGFTLDEESITGQLRIDDLKNKFDTKGSINANLSLAQIQAFYPMEDGDLLQGKLNLISDFKFNKYAIENNDYSNLKFDGECKLTDFIFKSNGILDTRIPNAQIMFTPKQWDIVNVKLFYGQSDFHISGKVMQPLNLLTTNGIVNMNLVHTSDLLDLDELRNSVANDSKVNVPSVSNSVGTPFLNYQIFFRSRIENIKFDTYQIKAAHGEGMLSGNKLKIPKMEAVINDNIVQGSADFDNIMDYSLSDKVLKGQLHLTAAILDLDKLMQVPESTVGAATPSEIYFSLPENMDLQIQFSAATMKFSPLTLNKLNGSMRLIEQTLEIQSATAEVASGKMQLSGLFEAKTNTQPVFNFKYDLKKLEFKNAFKSFHTVAKLAPLFNYIDGFFNSTFIFQGALKKDNFPDLMTVNIDGIIETLEGAIKGFKPLQDIASRVNVKELASLNIKNSKNWITVEKGIVKISEFSKNIGDVTLIADGMHPLEGDMAYNLFFDIPSHKTKAILNTIKLDEGIQYYNEIMSKIGFNQKLSSEMLIHVKLGGSILKPNIKVGLKPKSATQSSGNGLEQGMDLIKDSLAAKKGEIIEDLQNKAKDGIDRIADSIKAKGEHQLDKLKESAQEELLKKLDTSISNKASDLLKGPLDSLGHKIIPGGSSRDSIKNKIKEWNPFKKQKK